MWSGRTRAAMVVLALASALMVVTTESVLAQAATCNGLVASIVGTSGNDILFGTGGDDVIVGLDGNDVIRGLGGDDTICGDNGRDRLFGGRGNDALFGGKKNDILKGDQGRDVLFGNQGKDRLAGGGAGDVLEGGSGIVDRLSGRAGWDVCTDPQGGTRADTCEVLDLPGRVFTDEFNGSLDPNWSWLFPSGEWSLTANPGRLQILAQSPLADVLLRDAPDGPFRISTLVHFEPTTDFQLAGLVVTGSDFGDRVVFGHAFCGRCGGDGAYMDKLTGDRFIGNRVSLFDSAVSALHLSVIFDGSRYTAYSSEDGSTWRLVGSFDHELSNGSIGLYAGQGMVELENAQFESFTLNRL